MNIVKKSMGIVDGMETLEVINADTGEVIGYDQTAPPTTETDISIEEIEDEVEL